MRARNEGIKLMFHTILSRRFRLQSLPKRFIDASGSEEHIGSLEDSRVWQMIDVLCEAVFFKDCMNDGE